MSIVGWQMFENTGGESACPTITIGDQFYPERVPVVGQFSEVGALITGGTAPYTITTETGSVGGMTWSTVEFGGDYYVVANGTPTTFGIENVSIQVTDNNGCTSNLKVFTIEVWYEGIYTGPTDILGSGTANNYLITFPDLGTMGIDCEVVSMECSFKVPDLSQIEIQTLSPGAGIANYSNADLVGTTFTNTVFRNNTDPQINTGSDPYTGNWNSSDTASIWSDIGVGTSVGDWTIQITNIDALDGSISEAIITVKPL